MSREWRQSWNLLESGSFDVYINTTVPMITILDCLEVNIEVLDTSTETTGSNDYKEVSEDNGNANSVLAIIWEKARFSYKDKWKFINLFIQSISRLCWII